MIAGLPSGLRKPPAYAFLLVALCAVCVTYANHFDNGFHIDDWHTITRNPAIRRLANIPSFFRDARTSSVWPENQMYRPIVTTSTAIDYALGRGNNPRWFHISTFALFLIQLVTMWWLYRIILRKAGAAPRSDIVATITVAWYGLHPAIAETVNYIIQRADLYCTLGVVAAIALYAGLPAWRRFGAYLIPAAFALLSKPPAAAFPLLLLTYILCFERDVRAPFRHALRRSLPAFALTVAGLWLQHVMTPTTFTPIENDGRPFLATQPFVLMRFAASALLPTHLDPDSYLAPVPYFSLDAISGYLFLAVFTGIAIAFARNPRLRPTTFGMFWFLIAAMPTAVYPVSQTENDHRMFFPFVGLLFAIVWLVAESLRVARARGAMPLPPPSIIASGTIVVLVLYALRTVERNRIWHDDVSMWSNQMALKPHESRVIVSYGLSEMALGNFSAAEAAFARAARENRGPSAAIEIDKAELSEELGRPQDVETHFRRAVALGPNDDAAHFAYAKWLRRSGQLRHSQREAARAVEIDPKNVAERALLLHDDGDLGDLTAARRVAEGTLKLAPQDSDAIMLASPHGNERSRSLTDLSLRYYSQHRYTDSIAAARSAIAIDPLSAQAYNNIGAAEAELGNWDAAVAADRTAIVLDPTLDIAQNNLQWALDRGKLH